ncbi:MAG: efflux RND transporter periplasmic adaptor subunit, partial [Deltaproteobacteria bacterium]|nr:efflux RND transporter periplasmic adaptor subunit [Deltaproteobacteria bacterium]
AFFLLLLLPGSFLAGSWFSRREELKTDRSRVTSPAVNADEKVDPVPDPSSFPPGTVNINTEKQQLIGVQVATAEKGSWKSALRVLGRVAPDETRVYRINAAIDGWVKKIFPFTSDSLVQKDELLATFYAPEVYTAMRTLIYGLRALGLPKIGRDTRQQVESADANIENYRNALRNLGMTEYQLDEILRTRKEGDQVEIRAPAAGFILSRNLSADERFQKGTELYRIADLSKVWILVSTYESEASFFKPGMTAQVWAPNLKRTFSGRVAQVPPRFDPASRTLQVRLEVDNPKFLLRPDMFVDVELLVALPPAIAVPADAVLDSGLQKTVFMDRGNGYFEPREVETGWRMGNRVEIVRGLKPGERIVISGNFLIDSESKLELAAQGMHTPLSKDPVCGQDISPKRAEKEGRKSTYGGKTYYFDADECKQEFEKDPKRYATKPTGGNPHAPQAPSPKSPKKNNGHDH